MVKNLEEVLDIQVSSNISIRIMDILDIEIMVKTFQEANWQKPASLFENYLKEQENGKRIIWVAYLDNKFIGYITLKWESKFIPFKKKQIPEINDFNILPIFRGKGIGLKLLKKAEEKAATRSDIVGLGVGLYEDYGAA